jgi:hypothetical protein
LYLEFGITDFRNAKPDESFDRITSITPLGTKNHSKLTWMIKNIPELKITQSRRELDGGLKQVFDGVLS